MTLTFAEARAAVKVRLEAAEVAAKTVDPTIEMKFIETNRGNVKPDKGKRALHGYSRLATTVRFGVGGGFERHSHSVFIQIFERLNKGDAFITEVWEAMRASFTGNTGDQLQFAETSESQNLRITGKDGSHFGGLCTYPFHFYETRLPA